MRGLGRCKASFEVYEQDSARVDRCVCGRWSALKRISEKLSPHPGCPCGTSCAGTFLHSHLKKFSSEASGASLSTSQCCLNSVACVQPCIRTVCHLHATSLSQAGYRPMWCRSKSWGPSYCKRRLRCTSKWSAPSGALLSTSTMSEAASGPAMVHHVHELTTMRRGGVV